MIRRPPRSTLSSSSAASDVYKRQVEGEEMRLPLNTTDHHQRLAKINLRLPRRVMQWHKHLSPATLMLAHVILHDGVAAAEPVLIAKPIENPLGGVTLLAVLAEIVTKPPVNDLRETVQLR